MYNVIKNVISGKNYELSDILNKINTMWVSGALTDEQRAELTEKARGNALPENSYAGIQQQLANIWEKLKEQDEQLKVLKSMLTEETTPEETEEYPTYIQPTGVHDAYYNGDKITYTDGLKYICVAPEGVACVWSPEVYPAYWKAVEEYVEEDEIEDTEG